MILNWFILNKIFAEKVTLFCNYGYIYVYIFSFSCWEYVILYFQRLPVTKLPNFTFFSALRVYFLLIVKSFYELVDHLKPNTDNENKEGNIREPRTYFIWTISKYNNIKQ